MLKSRIHEDGWVSCETDFSHDYDDGDHLSARCLLLPDTENPNSDVKKSEIWETDILPFSGASMSSKSGRLQTKTITVKGDRKNASRPPSCRSVSAVSQRSGRTSRAIGEYYLYMTDERFGMCNSSYFHPRELQHVFKITVWISRN